jgi:hypothetical protein
MDARSTSRRSVVVVPTLLAVVVTAGCRQDDRTPIVGPRVVPASAQATITQGVGAAPDWTAFSADVDITTVGGPKSDTAIHRVHIDRSFDASGHWRTRVTAPLRAGSSPTSPSSKLLTSIELSESGNIVGAYDGDGNAMDVAKVMTPGGLSAASAGRKALPALPGGLGRLAANQDPHAWLDNIVATPEAAARIAQRLGAHGQKGTPAADGRDRFVSTVGDKTVETILDRATGAIAEEHLSRGGQSLYSAHHDYTQLPGGPVVRTHTRIEYAGNSSHPATMVVERTLSNVKLTRGGR